MRWEGGALRCAIRFEGKVARSLRTLGNVGLGKMFWWTSERQSFVGEEREARLYVLVQSSAANGTLTVSVLYTRRDLGSNDPAQGYRQR